MEKFRVEKLIGLNKVFSAFINEKLSNGIEGLNARQLSQLA